MSIKTTFFRNYLLDLFIYGRSSSNPHINVESIKLNGIHLEIIKDKKIDFRRNFKAYASEFDMDDLEELYCSIPELDTEFMDEGSDELQDTELISMFDVLLIFGFDSEIDIPLEKISITQTTLGFDNTPTPKRECVYKNGIISVRI